MSTMTPGMPAAYQKREEEQIYNIVLSSLAFTGLVGMVSARFIQVKNGLVFDFFLPEIFAATVIGICILLAAVPRTAVLQAAVSAAEAAGAGSSALPKESLRKAGYGKRIRINKEIHGK